MTRVFFSALLISGWPGYGFAMQDTTNRLAEVRVNAYFSEQSLLRLTTSAGVVGNALLDRQGGMSLLPAINSVPGVRMEERSPGSYRLSLRGSLLRSPFGVRNVKVYWDEIPLTDAGGNTYLNLLDPGGVEAIDVLKGPDGSLFGANSGGVVRIAPYGTAREGGHEASLRLNGGSYGLFHQQLATALQPTERYRFSFNQSHQRSDGYRQHSAMNRTAFQTVQRWDYGDRSALRLLALYSDLRYDTPGGLNEAQFRDDPRAARPATAAAPGAVEQQAGIRNKTLVGGLVHDTRLFPALRHVAAIFGSRTDFSNPFITNYELRDESNFGFRTYVDYGGGEGTSVEWHANVGMEWHSGKTDINNYRNDGGIRGEAMNFDALRSRQQFYFARFSVDVLQQLTVETSLSVNYYGYRFRTIFPEYQPAFSKRSFRPEWMPRAALSYLVTPHLALRASVSRGYSPPTIEEVRPSDQTINTALLAETGWNHEFGFRWETAGRRVFADGSIFYYRMTDAIIRQLNADDEEFFGNVGGVHQRGLELAIGAWPVEPRAAGVVRGLQLTTNLTVSRFRFGSYRVDEDDFSGNKLTGVPAGTVVSSVLVAFPKGIDAYVMHNHTSAIPLNDANTMAADGYHLLQAKVAWRIPLGGKLALQLFVGGDNLLNQRYSLGNDINAFVPKGTPHHVGRYFNASPLRNFYGGMAVRY